MPKWTIPNLAEIHTIVFDFDGIFTNNKVWIDQEGCESVCCDRSDGLAFDLIRAYLRRGSLKAEMFILSKEVNPVVLARAKKLGLECRHGVNDKLGYISQYLKSRMPDMPNPFQGLVYLGNDLNDLPVMRRAGYAVAPMDAHPLIQHISHLVLPKRGGDGFVRAFVEQLLGIENLLPEEIDELISDC